MSDFAPASSNASYAAFTQNACHAPSRKVKKSVGFFFPNHYRAPTHPQSQLLDQVISVLSQQLHERAAHMTNKDISRFMRCIANLDERREEAELAANPARQVGINRIGQRLAQQTKQEAVSSLSS